MYRPKNFKNPNSDTKPFTREDNIAWRAFEAGADAMLEDLKEAGKHGFLYDPITDCCHMVFSDENFDADIEDVIPLSPLFGDRITGYLVFIPD